MGHVSQLQVVRVDERREKRPPSPSPPSIPSAKLQLRFLDPLLSRSQPSSGYADEHILWLCDADPPLRGLYDEPNPDAQSCEKIDQSVDTEQVDAPPHKLADAGLCDAEEFRCLSLFQTAFCDGLLQVNHQIRTHLQVLGVLGREAEVAKDITSRTGDFEFHEMLTLLVLHAPSAASGIGSWRSPTPGAASGGTASRTRGEHTLLPPAWRCRRLDALDRYECESPGHLGRRWSSVSSHLVAAPVELARAGIPLPSVRQRERL